MFLLRPGERLCINAHRTARFNIEATHILRAAQAEHRIGDADALAVLYALLFRFEWAPQDSSDAEIAEAAGISKRAATDAMNRLERRGILGDVAENFAIDTDVFADELRIAAREFPDGLA